MPSPEEATGSTANTITVFIENEAGSDIKHHYNEETLEVLRTERVGTEYPYLYGFVPGTLAPDGDAADCFVITPKTFPTGSTLTCEPLALLEQTEGGDTDHNVLAILVGDQVPDLEEARSNIRQFLDRFMVGVPGRETVMGRLLPVDNAMAYLAECAAAAADRKS